MLLDMWHKQYPLTSKFLPDSDAKRNYEAVYNMACQAVAIDIRNVYAYLKGETWTPEQAPNITPAFDVAWFELPGWAIMCWSERVKQPSDYAPDIGWISNYALVGRLDDGIVTPFPTVTQVAVCADGKLKAVRQNEMKLPDVDGEPTLVEGAGADALGRIPYALMAWSFMHCKNVTLKECVPPTKLQKARQKRNRPPMVTYKTIEIEPMKEVLRREGKSETIGLQQALHICRGHFKDYRDSGLFGKHKGLYWWDMHTRGTAEAGRVAKDYRVLSPKQA